MSDKGEKGGASTEQERKERLRHLAEANGRRALELLSRTPEQNREAAERVVDRLRREGRL